METKVQTKKGKVDAQGGIVGIYSKTPTQIYTVLAVSDHVSKIVEYTIAAHDEVEAAWDAGHKYAQEYIASGADQVHEVMINVYMGNSGVIHSIHGMMTADGTLEVDE